MDDLVVALRAAAEPTRLRLLVLCCDSELTVSELVRILGQSQPRVSRHLKLLVDAGLLDRIREGSWVFHRLARQGAGAEVARRLVALVPAEGAVYALDRARLDEVKEARAAAAADYFRKNAGEWHLLRGLHVDEAAVERAVAGLLPDDGVGDLLDIGTGTGRILQVLAPRVRHAVGVDLSRDMLAVARANLERAGHGHCALRLADMYQLPFPDAAFDAVTIHQVLHFADHPGRVFAEAARVLRPGGRLLVADFAPHDLEYLRDQHEHRRLGFHDAEVADWLTAAGLQARETVRLPGEALSVVVWSAEMPGSMRTVDSAEPADYMLSVGPSVAHS